MSPIKTENLHFRQTDGIAALTLSGKIRPDTFSTAVEEFDRLNEEAPDTPIMLTLNKDNFDDLGQTRDAFRNFCQLLRRMPQLERCAVVSDSGFIRNSAKVEGASIPQLTLNTFALDGSDAAGKWLRGESLIETEDTSPAEETPGMADTQSAPADTSSKDDAEGSDNPWSNLNLKEVSY